MNAILLMMLAADPLVQGTPDVLLLDFTASYCGPCQQMLPIIQRMEDRGYPIRRIDATAEPQLFKKYHVERMPTFLLLVKGQEVWRIEGLTTEQNLCSEMKKAAQKLKDSAEAQDGEAEQSHPENHSGENERPEIVPPARMPNPGASIKGIFDGIFRPGEFDRPKVTVRGQSPQTTDHLAGPGAATVRVLVNGKNEEGAMMQDVGTGTIVHSAMGQSVILTCAHLFPEKHRDIVVEVDIFQNGKAARFPAAIVKGSHDSDLAILKIQNSTILPFVKLNQQPESLKKGQEVFSFGCDNGRPPSLLLSKILRINQFNGPANLTCEKDPVQGRSGGGLFDDRGQLLAVCSAADRKNGEGLYMSMPAIVALVKKCGMDHILHADAASTGEEVSPESLAGPGPDSLLDPVVPMATPEPSSPFDSLGQTPGAPAAFGAEAGSASSASASPGNAPSGPAAFANGSDPDIISGGTEITVLIDSKDPAVGKRVIVIPKATPWLLELLTGESGEVPQNPVQRISARRPVSEQQSAQQVSRR